MDILKKDDRVRELLTPTRVVASYNAKNEAVFTDESVPTQVLYTYTNENACELKKGSWVLLDFGREINGSIRIITNYIQSEIKSVSNAEIRISLGESVSEAMSSIGEKNATNNHTPRDIKMLLSRMGGAEYGESGFRFARIEVLSDVTVGIQKVYAIYTHDGAPMLGSFECNDSLLNDIWKTGTYNVYLNMQNYLFDGIKRDRLVWIGDMHPEVSTICTTFGKHKCVERSLDFVRDTTPRDAWMNGIATYSMWWVIIHYDWYMHWGDFEYLSQQKDYLMYTAQKAVKWVNSGYPRTGGSMLYFVDWSSADSESEIEGVKALFALGLSRMAKLLELLDEKVLAEECKKYSEVIKAEKSQRTVNKRIAALNVLADRYTGREVESLTGNSAEEMSCFLGYYILLAKQGLVDCGKDSCENIFEVIRKFWGGMLSMGATAFWEDFDIKWLENSYRIDELQVEGKNDIHGYFGKYCYKQLRHSLCHGWASGPTAYLSSYVLGVEIMEAGCKKIAINPHLGNLKWVKGTYPTPYGVVEIEHNVDNFGRVVSKINAPLEIKVIYK